MRAPDFWWQDKPGPLALCLAPFGALYGAITARRMARSGVEIGLPVICVGNLVAGGQGKTPVVEALARILLAEGACPFALARGYGGALKGPLRVDPLVHSAADVGDEPRQLADTLPVIVSADRVAGAALAKAEGATHILMDDGLQNPSLAKSLRLAVVDGRSGFGNGRCIPAGPLRAPVLQQWPHVDAVILIGEGAAGERVVEEAQQAEKPVLRAWLQPDTGIASTLNGLDVLALSGIGRPEKFEITLSSLGARIVARQHFGDHFPYAASDVAAMIANARMHGAKIVTTTKDWTKLAPLWPTDEAARVTVLPVSLVFEAPETARQLVLSVRGALRA
jgi:tetraacyldisaccharide 4'-kinase